MIPYPWSVWYHLTTLHGNTVRYNNEWLQRVHSTSAEINKWFDIQCRTDERWNTGLPSLHDSSSKTSSKIMTWHCREYHNIHSWTVLSSKVLKWSYITTYSILIIRDKLKFFDKSFDIQMSRQPTAPRTQRSLQRWPPKHNNTQHLWTLSCSSLPAFWSHTPEPRQRYIRTPSSHTLCLCYQSLPSVCVLWLWYSRFNLVSGSPGSWFLFPQLCGYVRISEKRYAEGVVCPNWWASAPTSYYDLPWTRFC